MEGLLEVLQKACAPCAVDGGEGGRLYGHSEGRARTEGGRQVKKT